ncbi:MAG: leucine--tRNA ligase [Myxococcales bacterium]
MGSNPVSPTDPRSTAPVYDHEAIEARWQRVWEEKRLFEAGRRPGAPKFYALEMFPYPSGAMHMGHARVYAIGDVIARFARMRGKDVLHPMGYDALGLPAENAAIKDGIHPAIRTRDNIASFREEMKSMGFSFDWTRELATSDPSYYRWNQWFFVKMLERDLVYRRQGWVNWCPSCLTVLANEQVEDGVCWRGHPGVTRKPIGEWAFRITRYAEELLADLDRLGEWPERITSMQRNWIGKSEGAEIDFALEGRPEKLRVYTTRLDTIYGCTFVVLAPEHPLALSLASPAKRDAIAAFAKRMLEAGEVARTAEGAPKEGLDTGARALNPFTGKSVPVWVASFVLGEYGTGAVMSVPAHDQRDFEFAKKHGLPIEVAIQPAVGERLEAAALAEASTGDGVCAGGLAAGKSSAEARALLTAHAEQRGFGKAKVNYHLRDWGFSRQRYWGTPIPIVYCERCGSKESPKAVPVPVEQLPVLLPDEAVLEGKGEPPLAKIPSFMQTVCPVCGGPARREPETMDTFVDSCWYFARFLSPRDEARPFDPEAAKRWLPIDVYIGGPEHAVLHLLYFRFWTKVMADLGLLEAREPARRLITQGIVLGPDGEKMSKSRGNVVSPRAYVERFGADTARLFVLFAGPVERDYAWNDAQVEGLHRFLTRVWRLFFRFRGEVGAGAPTAREGRPLALRQSSHRTLAKVTADLERNHFNTAIAALMEHVNAISAWVGEEGVLEGDADRAALREAFEILAVGLSPFAPHVAEELWLELGHAQCLQESTWPAHDPALAASDTLKYAVQVNGKLRGEVEAAATAAEAEVVALAKAEPKVAPHLEGKTLRKTVFVPKRLVNFVVG